MDIQYYWGLLIEETSTGRNKEAATAHLFLKLPVALLYVDSVAKIQRPETSMSSSFIGGMLVIGL